MRKTPCFSPLVFFYNWIRRCATKKKNENTYVVSKRPESWLVQFYHVHRIVVVKDSARFRLQNFPSSPSRCCHNAYLDYLQYLHYLDTASLLAGSTRVLGR